MILIGYFYVINWFVKENCSMRLDTIQETIEEIFLRLMWSRIRNKATWMEYSLGFSATVYRRSLVTFN